MAGSRACVALQPMQCKDPDCIREERKRLFECFYSLKANEQ